jgi:signal transduction histidine kinase/CheY-like chemotaxis protein
MALDGERFPVAGGRVGAMMRAHDWTRSPLGPPSGWPAALRAVVGLMVDSQFPMFVAWGPELAFLYNDAYGPILGARHPAALGRPFHEIWHEIWDDIAPLIARALAGEATFNEDLHLVMERNGYPEDTWYSFSYSPVRDVDGTVGGMFCACVETTAKVLADRRVRAERDRLTRLFEQAPGFICTLSGPDHVFEFANAAHRRLFGSEHWIGLPIRAAFPALEGQGFLDWLDRAYAGERQVVLGAPIRYQLGGEVEEQARYLDFIYEPMRDESGEITGVFCEGYDVTDRLRAEAEARRAELALHASESRYRRLFEAIDEGFCILEAVEVDGDPLGDFVYLEANPALEANSGIRDVVGRRVSEVLGDEAPGWIAMLAGVARTGELLRFERPLETTDRILELAVFRVEGDALPQVAVLFQDISARREAERALTRLNDELESRVAQGLAERRLLADLVEGTDAFVQVASPDYRWLAFNRAAADEFERVFGRRPSVGASMLDQLDHLPDQRAQVEQAWRRAFDGEAYVFTGEFGDAGRDSRHYEIRFRPLHDAQGQRIGAYQFVYDVTDRLRDQRRLAEAEAALHQAQKLETIGQLTGGVAHDFNNLLTPIVYALEMQKRRGGGDPVLAQMTDGAMRAAERARTLVQRLLSFSRRQHLRPRAVDVGGLVRNMAELMLRSLGPRMQLALDIDEDLPAAHVDPGQLELALLNLAVNARDAMNGVGELTIAVAADQARAAATGATMVRIAVSDTGCGMDADTLKRATEPFFTTKEVGRGTGLGLSSVQGLALQSGGGFELSSAPGTGTVATLWLPASEDAVEVAPPSPEVAVGPAATGAIVLLVDDEELARVGTRHMLEEAGYFVSEATSGEEALARLRDGKHVDALVTDYAMPGMSGAALAQAARGLRPGLPVLLVTGYATLDDADAERLPRLSKPYAAAELVQALARVMA